MGRPAFSWPSYVQPRAGHERPPADAPLQLPAMVLDLFYARADATTAPALIAVLGCLGGGIMVAAPPAIPSLPADLQAVIRAAEVNVRGQFRLITARELWIASLDAIEQAVQAHGYNDAVSLYGRVHARIIAPGPSLSAQVFANDASITVGRLDLLYGWRMGFVAPFHHPLQISESITHALIPIAPNAVVQQGAGIALVYPFFDPARLSSSDNAAMVMQIVYDLLLHLQHDLQEHGHALAGMAIPVPSRAQLEAELAADGYRIDGNTAVRTAPASQPASAASFLGRMRRWARQWAAPSLALPPQATPADYQRIIDELLAAITTPADLAMLNALRGCVGPLIAAQPPRPPAAATRRGPAPSTSAPATRAAPRSAPAGSRASWANDFTAPPRPATDGAPAHAAWWADFQRDGSPATVVSTQDDWSAPANPPAPTSPESDWKGDFDTSPGPPPAAPAVEDWSKDFD